VDGAAVAVTTQARDGDQDGLFEDAEDVRHVYIVEMAALLSREEVGGRM
jgi:hypothetical protein